MPHDLPTLLSYAVYRSDWGRIVATLIRLVGDFDVAEEAAQEAFAAACRPVARFGGVPELPRAWIARPLATKPSIAFAAACVSKKSWSPTQR